MNIKDITSQWQLQHMKPTASAAVVCALCSIHSEKKSVISIRRQWKIKRQCLPPKFMVPLESTTDPQVKTLWFTTIIRFFLWQLKVFMGRSNVLSEHSIIICWKNKSTERPATMTPRTPFSPALLVSNRHTCFSLKYTELLALVSMQGRRWPTQVAVEPPERRFTDKEKEPRG